MSLEYNANAAWPIEVLAKFVEVRELNGYHVIYKNGFVRGSNYEIKTDDIGYIDNGWTARVFMFRRDLENGASLHMITTKSYWCKVIVKDGATSVMEDLSGFDGTKYNELGPQIKAGDVFSLAIRRRKDRYLTAIVNDTEGNWMNMKESNSIYTFKFKIWQRNLPILSIHLTNEFKTEWEESHGKKCSRYVIGCKDHFDLPKIESPPGSSFIALLQLEKPDEDVDLGIKTDHVEYQHYGKIPGATESMLVSVYIRNLPNSYVMSTSFDPQPKIIVHKTENTRYIEFFQSYNFLPLRLTHPADAVLPAFQESQWNKISRTLVQDEPRVPRNGGGGMSFGGESELVEINDANAV
ncbi:hypothetical protein MTO96_028706 [Rhipicephalus appendiculatus]